MIFAKHNAANTEILEFPLSEYDIRAAHNNISLPNTLNKDNLPSGYTIILDSVGEPISSKYSLVLRDKKDILLKNIENSTWYTEIILKDLENLANVPASQEISIAAIKIRKIKELVEYSDQLVDTVTQRYKIPEVELQTWNIQFIEASEWEKDNSYPTPTLDAIARFRDVNPYMLKVKALQKAIQYKTIVGFVVGRKQFYEDLIENATTIEEINRITFDINLKDLFALQQEETVDDSTSE